ncbi:MAG: hypothetical protein O3C40_03275 [Planctomycetota bacterium]|nr:hypothetical protein [Planctomycetota bacterium]
MLRSRLARRGITISAAVFAATLTSNVGAAVVPATFVSTTTQAASLFAAGKTVAGSALSAQAAALANGGLQVMFAAKFKLAAFVTLASVVLVAGGTVFVQLAFGMTEEQKKDFEGVQGTWKVVAYEKDGKQQPKEQFADINTRLVFDGNKFMQ